MKTLLYFLIGFVLCFGPFNWLNAQEVDNPQEAFANKDWFLIKIVMEGVEYPFVPAGSIPYGLLETTELETYNENLRCYFMVDYCEMCATDACFLSATEFKIMGWGDCLAYDNCMYTNDPDLFEFSHLYESLFWNRNNATDNEESFFEFSISETNGNMSMVITKDNGNQAYYGDEPLSASSFEKNEITLYPNPVKDYLYIENLTEKVELEIYNLSGSKLISQELMDSSESIKVSQLSRGIYIYRLNQNGKTVKTGKLIKN